MNAVICRMVGDAPTKRTRRLFVFFGLTPIGLCLASIATAQNTSVSGQITAPDGTPWVGIEVIIENMNTGRHFEVKTDNDGRYVELGLPPGVYKITIYDQRNKSFTYSEIHTLRGTQENDISANFSKNGERSPLKAQTKEELEEDKFNNVKTHVNVGVGAMYDSDRLRIRLATAPAGQKGPLQEKLNSDCQTAIAEFSLAENLDPLTSVKTHAMIWAHLGESYECAGLHDDATNAYQKAVSLRPEAVYYRNLSTAQVSSALARTDPNEKEQKLADAEATCENATALDRTEALGCWKNIGILLTNKGDMQDAITPLQKTTQLNSEDAQAWFLLGTALLSGLETKQDGSVMTARFPTGTAEAFQRCIDADPNGPYAFQARELLDGLASMSPTGKTAVIKKKD
jgi:Flp pilus assembly protein TadD